MGTILRPPDARCRPIIVGEIEEATSIGPGKTRGCDRVGDGSVVVSRRPYESRAILMYFGKACNISKAATSVQIARRRTHQPPARSPTATPVGAGPGSRTSALAPTDPLRSVA